MAFGLIPADGAVKSPDNGPPHPDPPPRGGGKWLSVSSPLMAPSRFPTTVPHTLTLPREGGGRWLTSPTRGKEMGGGKWL
jgi:hypothetical protein